MAFYAEGILFVAPFNLDRLEISGTPVPVLENVSFSQFSDMASYTFSALGSLLYLPGGVGNLMLTPAWVDRQGNASPLPIPAGDYAKPALSPDGSQIALRSLDWQERDIFVYDLARGSFSRLTFFEGPDSWPVWSPDGLYITFNSNRSGNYQLYRKRADGSGDAEELTGDLEKTEIIANAWSPDGTTLVFSAYESGFDLWTLRMDENDRPGSPEPFLETRFNESDATFSPDGRWLAYMSDESGRWEVYVSPFPEGDGKWQVSTAGGRFPIWARNTRQLFYRHGDKMMIVSYSSSADAFIAEPPLELFAVPTVEDEAHETYDVTPDGKRFLVLIPEEDSEGPATDHAILVLNWFDEIKRLVPKEN
jgi:serine/threonine-protein kinase